MVGNVGAFEGRGRKNEMKRKMRRTKRSVGWRKVDGMWFVGEKEEGTQGFARGFQDHLRE